MFAQMSFWRFSSHLLTWPFRFANQLGKVILSRSRFLLITPPILRTQVVFDGFKKKRIRVHIRDQIDYQVLRQIFIEEDYKISRLARKDDLFEQYQEILISANRPLIIDCGGNCGISASYFRVIFPEAKIICIEPDISNLNMAKSNNHGDIEFMQAAVGGTSGRGVILDSGNGNWALQVKDSPNGDVAIVTVSEVLNNWSQKGFVPFLIKLDIEGSEKSVFETDSDWIDDFPLIIIELHDWLFPRDAVSRNFLSAVSKKNRDFVFFGENVFSIRN